MIISADGPRLACRHAAIGPEGIRGRPPPFRPCRFAWVSLLRIVSRCVTRSRPTLPRASKHQQASVEGAKHLGLSLTAEVLLIVMA